MALDRHDIRREFACLPREHADFPPFEALPADPDRRLDAWLEAATLQPVSATEWECFEDWRLGPRVINDSMWFFFTHGTGWGEVVGRGERFAIAPGDLMLIPQGAEHIVRQAPGVAMRLIAVHFLPHVFSGVNLLNLAGFPSHAPARLDAPDAPYARVSQRLAREFACKAPGWRQVFRAGVMEVLTDLTRREGARFRPLTAAPGRGQLPRVLPALEKIEARLTDPALNVVELAQTLFVSEVQFRKLFRRATGLSPIRFIQRRRIEHACTLLRGSGLSIEQVAGESGFSDAPFFYRVFKHWTGTTPALYRTQGGV
ncbi:MAG: helix-turn-helix domain-containing protein [Rhodanobacteraceae bacterium]